MKRKLQLLNLALVTLLVATGWRIWVIHDEAQARQEAVLGQDADHQPVAPPPSASAPAALSAVRYFDVAEELLFSPDRNPVVEIEAAPEQPLPPLPTAHGILDIGSGPTAILSLPGEEGQVGYRVGDPVGDFVLVGITASELAFQWTGGVVRRSIDELRPREPVEGVPAAPPPPPKTVAAEKPKSTVLAGSAKGPSDIDMGGGILACRPSDTAPAGTVVNGYRKILARTPFGETCRWEPVQ